MAKYVHVSFDTVEEFKPRIPSNRCEGEDNTIERICVSSDVFHAINAMPCGGESLWNMHQIGMPLFIHAYYLQINEEYVMKNKEVCQYVPDAYLTKEEWLLKKPNKTYRVDYIIENPMFITENTDKGILHKLVCGELKRVKYENSWQKFWIWVSGKDIIEPLNISFGRFIGNLDDEMKKQIKKRKNKEETSNEEIRKKRRIVVRGNS